MLYSREFLIEVFLFRFERYFIQVANLRKIAEKFYDENGRDEFRKSATITPEAIREYKNWLETI